MKKSDLIALVRRAKPRLASHDAAQIVDIFFDRIAEVLVSGGRVELRGLGSFSTRSIDARTACNPRTGMLVEVVKKRHPYFKPSGKLARRLRGTT